MEAFREILAIPFGWILSFLYMFSQNYLFSLLILTLFFRIILLPSSIKQQKGAAKQLRMQSKISKIKEKYKGDNRRIQEEQQALYQREGYSAMTAGCAPMLIQLPVMLGLYGVIYTPLSNVLRISGDIIDILVEKAAEIVAKAAEIAGTAPSPGGLLGTAMASGQIDVLRNFPDILAALGNAIPANVVEEIEKFN
ncbi:MAG: YidC/Oxa1 family membrane protein insertase, partial [Oscillospiraceae bacterium]|nr:YidC/Oxa1 family membrane protein insertase [Oscillospiraceae bacterium]